MVSLCSKVLSKVILIMLLSKSNMVIPKENLLKTKNILQFESASHLTNLVLPLHVLVLIGLFIHLFEEVVFVNCFSLNQSILKTLLLHSNRTFISSFISKILQKGHCELIAKNAM